jgi:hypothetical protein
MPALGAGAGGALPAAGGGVATESRVTAELKLWVESPEYWALSCGVPEVSG